MVAFQIVDVHKKLVRGNAGDHPKLQKSKCQEHLLRILFATTLDSAIARSKFSKKHSSNCVHLNSPCNLNRDALIALCAVRVQPLEPEQQLASTHGNGNRDFPPLS